PDGAFRDHLAALLAAHARAVLREPPPLRRRRAAAERRGQDRRLLTGSSGKTLPATNITTTRSAPRAWQRSLGFAPRPRAGSRRRPTLCLCSRGFNRRGQ